MHISPSALKYKCTCIINRSSLDWIVLCIHIWSYINEIFILIIDNCCGLPFVDWKVILSPRNFTRSTVIIARGKILQIC